MTRQPLLSAAALLMVGAAPPVCAQGLAGRVALEAVASASSEARAVDDPLVMFDLIGTARRPPADGTTPSCSRWCGREVVVIGDAPDIAYVDSSGLLKLDGHGFYGDAGRRPAANAFRSVSISIGFTRWASKPARRLCS